MAPVTLEHYKFALAEAGEKDGDFECWGTTTPDGTIYCKLEEFAVLLGYESEKKVHKLILAEWKIEWQKLKLKMGTSATKLNEPSNWHPDTLFVSEPGIYSLLARSHKPVARKRMRFVYERVMPTIRKAYCGSVMNDTSKAVVTVNDGRHDVALSNNDERVNALQIKLFESNESLRRANENLIEFAKEMVVARREAENARRETAEIANRIADIAQDVISKPSDPNLLHSLTVCETGENEFAFLRPQKRSLKRSLKRLSVDERNIIFKSDYVPNGTNVLNTVKEKLPRDQYRARNNKITLLDGLNRETLVEAIGNSLTSRQVEIIRKSAVRQSSPKKR